MVGMHRDFLDQSYASCELVGHLANQYGIANTAIEGYTDVFLCRRLPQPPHQWRMADENHLVEPTQVHSPAQHALVLFALTASSASTVSSRNRVS